MVLVREVVAFNCEYFDPHSKLIRTFRLNSFDDGTLELLEKKRMFLKRIYSEDVTRDVLYVGSVIHVFGKTMEVVGPADEGTLTYLESETSTASCVARIDGDASDLVRALEHHLTRIKALKSVALKDLSEDLRVRLGSVPGDLVVGVEVFDASTRAREKLSEAVSRLENVTVVFTEEGLDPTLPNDASEMEGTLCLVKPHVLRQKKSSELMAEVSRAGFKIAGLQLFFLDLNMAHNFFAAYKGVWPQYEEVVEDVARGPCLALLIRSTATSFRNFAGPHDVEIAKILRPNSLRATFGMRNVVNNAIHCTDLDQDAKLECTYFFKLLATGSA